jgi:putative transcriptional regulator
MADWSERNVETAASILNAAGFAVSQRCLSRPSCFDFAARKMKMVVLIKCQVDVGSLSPENAHELRLISESVSASTLLISANAGEMPLQDDTVYTKHNILAVTPRTFENVMIRGLSPIVRAGPGGFCVEIDPETIRKRRQQLGLSVGEMAEMIGTSKRTLYGYERGLAKASVPATYKLIWTLGVPIAVAINVFEKPSDRNRCLFAKAKHILAGSRVLRRIFKKLEKYHVTPVSQAPFDFLVSVPQKGMRIMGAVVEKKEEGLDRRIDELLSLSKIVETQPVLITDGQRVSERGIPCLNCRDLSKVKEAEDLISIAK